ncbi:MAG: diphosphomevalonate decarboxylase [Candidatus Diapherotrites archaeon]
MKATAIANSNIALVKYWGKRDEKLVLPKNSSISMALDKLHTTTTVEFSKKLKEDSLKIDGRNATEKELERVSKHLDLVRKEFGEQIYARIESKNNFPKAAGLASSASAFAALSLAATKALDLHLDKKELSIIARQGSGSASRSIAGGFVEFEKGSQPDGSDSFAKQIAPQDHWEELRMVVVVLTTKEKKVGSSEGMDKTTLSSELYHCWMETIDKDLKKVREAIIEKNFPMLGRTAEMNALKMHSTMITTEPHLIYWEPETISIMKEIMKLREEGTECYFTIDAGPQVKILCLENNVKKIENHFSKFKGVKKLIVCKTGGEAKLIEEDLF